MRRGGSRASNGAIRTASRVRCARILPDEPARRARYDLRVPSPLPPAADLARAPLDGRVVLVTGASGGIGRPLSIACARAGATVVLHGRVVRKLEALYDEIVA